jgi:hypothetical protein
VALPREMLGGAGGLVTPRLGANRQDSGPPEGMGSLLITILG